MELKANRSDIDKTQYQLWYEELKPWAIRSEFVHLPPEFVDYLKQDGIFLPSHLNYVQENTSSDDESDGDQVGSSLNRSHVDTPSFPDFDQLLLTAMNNLGGDVAIKTNWSSPLDVTWMTLGSLKASSLRDIYLQLKSSDRIMFDLEHMYDQCDDEGPKYLSHPVLVLRKWANLLPSMEFRVFVRDWKLVGISQRDCCTFYPFMSSKINEIEEIIRAFFLSNIADKELPRDYCMDVYIDKKERVWIIDVNSFGLPSSSLLFEWEDLHSADTCLVKYVENESQKMHSVLGTKRGPIDVHMAPDFSKFMEICQQQQNQESSDDDSNS